MAELRIILEWPLDVSGGVGFGLGAGFEKPPTPKPLSRELLFVRFGEFLGWYKLLILMFLRRWRFMCRRLALSKSRLVTLVPLSPIQPLLRVDPISEASPALSESLPGEWASVFRVANMLIVSSSLDPSSDMNGASSGSMIDSRRSPGRSAFPAPSESL
jgi:hypothetical protein